MMFSAAGGGTVSGFGGLPLVRLSVDYGKKSKLSSKDLEAVEVQDISGDFCKYVQAVEQ